MSDSAHENYSKAVTLLEKALDILPNPEGEQRERAVKLARDLSTCGYSDVEQRAKKVLKRLGVGGLCCIATAACGTAQHTHVVWLRTFRDVVLDRWAVGRLFIRLYERLSPPLAAVIRGSAVGRALVRWFVVGPAACVARALSRRQ